MVSGESNRILFARQAKKIVTVGLRCYAL